MLTIVELTRLLRDRGASFEIIHHPDAILTVKDAEKYFDSDKAAPVFVMLTEKGLVALIVSAARGKINFKQLGKLAGFSRFKMADKRMIMQETGYETGALPLIGLELPTLIDKRLLELDYIYGGTGNQHYTLKIAPGDVARMNSTILTADY